MAWPTISLDNFLEDPDLVANYAKKLEFFAGTLHPGYRTKCLSESDFDFYNAVNLKILSVYFPYETANLRFKADTFFQLVPPNMIDGFVHRDTYHEITGIVYLSEGIDAGTSLFKPLKPFPGNFGTHKYEYFSKFNNKEKLSPAFIKKYKDHREECLSYFKKTQTINSEYNRLLIIDSNAFHAAETYEAEENAPHRLTLISFIRDIINTEKTIKRPGEEHFNIK